MAKEPRDKFAFLLSPRFWKLGAIGVSVGLEEYTRTGRWEVALLATLSVWLGGSVVVGTVGKFSEAIERK